MSRRPPKVVVALLATTLVSCALDQSPTLPAEGGPTVGVAIQPALIPSAADADALPINRIRASAARYPEGAVLTETVMDVSPSAPTWEVLLSVPGSGDGGLFVLYLYLINVAGDGSESVQFSGRTDPLEISAGVVLEPDVPLVRGPLDNLFTTGVSIAEAPTILLEGETAGVAATATTSAPTPPTIYWASLDESVLTISGTTITAEAPGEAQLVASAGAFADTATVVVLSSDTLAPVVLSTSPAASAIDVSRSVVVEATFDEPVDPATVTTSTFRLLDVQGAPVPGVATTSGSTVSFDPSVTLDSLASYTAILEGGITDFFGNELGEPYSWTFRTTDASVYLGAQFNPGLGNVIAVAFDDVTGNIFVYDDFATEIHEYTQAGVEVLPTIPTPGGTANDYDLEFLPYSTAVGPSDVPGNTLLVLNGEISPRTAYAVNKDDGTVLDSLQTTLTNPVGGSFHPERQTLFAVDWVDDTVTELELSTGAVIANFPMGPVGAPAFDMYYGDVEVAPTSGNLILVSSAEASVRIMSPTGVLITDIPVAQLGITGMSGIAIDQSTGAAWITSTTGEIFQVFGLVN